MRIHRSRQLGARAFALLFLVLAGGALLRSAEPVPPLLLVSMDGFRWDYCALHPAETPHLRQLMREGVSARALIPVYPSNTFPNHYSIATGLYPSHHGIINNHFYDPALGTFFHYNHPAMAQDNRWWGGEPIWVTAVKQGRKSASSFWVGSEAAINGVRPTFWKPFDYKIPFAKRLDEVSGWLHLPADQRPAIITFYFEETNSAGHSFGPDAPELAAAVQLLDSELGMMLDRLKAEGLLINVLVVSDHGMTNCSADRIMVLDDFIDPNTVQVDFDETSVGLRPLAGTDTNAIMRALAHLPHGTAYRTEDLPARFHVSANPRNPAVWIVPEEGWNFLRRAQFEAIKGKFLKGQHGYDNALDSMHGILIANGPSFKNDGTVIEPVENVNIYNLMCAVLHLTPAPNDGDDRLVRAMLR
jgi:predicted AlkP superfamily pyrophosphatase or phosphodiesterase